MLPKLKIKNIELETPIIQGGMGVGVSLHPLASAVAREGGMGVVSSACLDRLVSSRRGKRVNSFEAAHEEVSLAKEGGFAGINIMVALVKDYEASVRGAIEAGADAVISGAGLPMQLPSVAKPKDTALIPIVSSARALEIICRRWERQGYRPDAAVLEGPLAGGHLGFKLEEIHLEENTLERLLPPVKDVAERHGGFPIIVAGGVYSHEDILRFLRMGADGVQMGTRFLCTEESGATPDYKQAVLDANEEDILVASRPGSPCGLPFRVLRDAPMYRDSLKALRPPKCDKGYVLLKDDEGKFTRCAAKENNRDFFCICNGLLCSAGYNPDKEKGLFTVGALAHRVKEILPVKALMDELRGRVLVGETEN